MGSPRLNPGNLVGDLVAGVNRGVADMARGAKEMATGRFDEGLSMWITGGSAVTSGGLSERIGLETQTSKDLKTEKAEAEAVADAENLAASQVNMRKDAIKKRLDAEVQLRIRTPGRQQTLLTAGLGDSLLPGARNTLLSTGKK